MRLGEKRQRAQVGLIGATLATGFVLTNCALEVDDGAPDDVRQVRQHATESSVVSQAMMNRRWPNGVIPVRFHPGFDSARKARARAALFGSTSEGACSSASPCPGWDSADAVRFIDCERDADECDQYNYYLNLIASPTKNGTGRKRGFEALETEELKPNCNLLEENCRNGACDFESGETCVFDVWLLASQDNFMWRMGHEIGHALGFNHEQARSNRGDFLDLSGCTGDGPQEIRPDEQFILGYDVKSIMQYYLFDNANDETAKVGEGQDRCFKQRSGQTLVYGQETNLPTATDMKKLQLLYGVRGEFRRNGSWCIAGGSEIYLGDFDADGRNDLLCHSLRSGYSATGRRWIDYANDEFNGTDWDSGSGTFCHGGNRHLVVGDFDGDGQSDAACHNAETGSISIDYANNAAELNGKDWPSSDVQAWDCKGQNVRAYAGDFNADGRDDLLCHDHNTGRRKIDHANSSGQFSSFNWSSDDSGNSSWCTGSKETLYVGYFDADGSADVVCHDDGDGRLRLDFAFEHGNLKGTDYDSDSSGDQFCWGADRTVLVGDVTGDGLSDILCHNKSIGSISVTRANANVGWRDGKGLGSSSSFYDVAFCTMEDSQLFVGRFGLDSRADLLCHNRATGHKAVLSSKSNGAFQIP